jgi:hypothetical protein
MHEIAKHMAPNKVFPIHLSLNGAQLQEPGSTETALRPPFLAVAEAIQSAYRERYGGAVLGHADAIALTTAVDDFLLVADALDAEHGPDALLPQEDAAQAADEALRCAAELESWLPRFALDEQIPALQNIALGIGLWCMRHELPIDAPETIVNALANRANISTTTQDTAATFALMQGFLLHLAPTLSADLERSDPQRPWRLLNLNLAITAIRSGDETMIRYAFTQLNKNLPDERRGFYDEAYALASQPGFPVAVRALIEAELAAHAPRH